MRTLEEIDYLAVFQSGFRMGLKTEAALVTLVYDLWQSQDGVVHPTLCPLISQWLLIVIIAV